MKKKAESKEALSRVRELLLVSLGSAFSGRMSSRRIRLLAGRFLLERKRIQEEQVRARRPESRIRIRGAGPLEEEHRQGRGGILCTIRMGAWLSVPMAGGQLGIGGVILADEGAIESLGGFIRKKAASLGVDLDLLSAQDPRSMVRALRTLKEGRFVFLLLDSNSGLRRMAGRKKNAAVFPFLSMPVQMRVGAAYLAAKAGVSIHPALHRRGRFGWRGVQFLRPIPPPETPSEEGLAAKTHEVYAVFERWVRRHPEQWEGWLYPFLYWADAEPPKVTREEWEAEAARLQADLRRGGRLRCRTDPIRVASIDMAGEAVLLDGGGRRMLRATKASLAILEAAKGGIRLGELVARLEIPAADACRELARLTLTGLVTA